MNIDTRTSATLAGAAQVNESSAASALSRSKGDLSGGIGSGDTVELSGPLRVLQTLANNREARIAQLTQSVRNGTYSANAQDVSRALVQETLAGAAQ